ncbi:RagB/SusD family nutrient uptake outer membrane protein [Oceanihabitans sp. 2_MG-2023]|uniref:RagB/SusD family nutrient uptake outer membrane protein n=1 Tax=Oceanihabitans sp. 2_MG-2023 TaxID=3062661 RepID=UPI0026E408E6|nr:RagB/SusD family nutrient uptake outer membrane protein [Oceanihabitans sp. 2_MG-2023]MDO6596565.1 RagB/SusD family nutrient uptake outer membrane protein [Oceanihabitans sp. 2_MG-2023]
MKNIKFLIVALAGSIFISCDTEEFLNPLPDTVVVVDTFFETDADVLAGVIGVYDALQGVNENTETNIGDFNRGVQFEHLLTEHRTDNTRNATLEGSKSDFHRYVVTANNVESEDYYQSMYEVIFRVNNVLNFMDVADDSNRAKYTAEVKFLRAYAYFNLVRLFGDVPLVTTVLGPEEDQALFTRIDSDLIYEQIIEDLLEAANTLDNTYKSRASQAAAQALLAKVYLTQGTNYVAAQQLCESIIGGQYSLQSNYYDVFYNELNNEIIFAIQYLSGDANESQSFSSEFTSGVRAGREDGQNIVNDNLIADFNMYGGIRTDISYTTVLGSNEVAKFLPDGFDANASPTPYGPNARNAGNDYIAIRYADVLLMHVEAIMGQSSETSNSNALNSFKEVRDRAFPDTAPNIVTSVTKEELLRERRVEFAFENQRYFDLVRFGVLDAVLSAHSDEMGYVYDPRKALLLPIPAREINLSGGLLTQNPGY